MLVVGIDPGLNEVGVAGVDGDSGVLQVAALVRLPAGSPGPKYAAIVDRVIDEVTPWLVGVDEVWVERPGIHGIVKRGQPVAGTSTAAGVTRNWVVIEDLLAVSERLQYALHGRPAYVIGRKGATDWQSKSWCGRQSKAERHETLLRLAQPEEVALVEASGPPSLRHNALDAWCIARWAWRGGR